MWHYVQIVMQLEHVDIDYYTFKQVRYRSLPNSVLPSDEGLDSAGTIIDKTKKVTTLLFSKEIERSAL